MKHYRIRTGSIAYWALIIAGVAWMYSMLCLGFAL